ncbi:hypothetical protein AVEN_36027-1, partial [Araneus ventricosus]
GVCTAALTAKPKRLRTEQRVEAEGDDWMEDEADNEKNKRKISLQEGSFPLSTFFVLRERKYRYASLST